MIEPTRPAIHLVLGTRNRKKGQEMIAASAARLGAEPAARPAVDRHPRRPIPTPPTSSRTRATFEANARKKASETAPALGRWVLADDSGLAVDALGGAPGVFSARYAGAHGDDEANNRKVLAALAGRPDDRAGRGVRLRLALADPTGTIRLEAAGACRGRITRRAPRRERVRLRPAVPDPRVPPDLRRAQPRWSSISSATARRAFARAPARASIG